MNNDKILYSIPFIVTGRNYPILHLMIGKSTEAFCHIFDQNHFVLYFNDFDETTEEQRDIVENYLDFFIRNHYEFICENINHDESIHFDLMKFFLVDDFPDEII